MNATPHPLLAPWSGPFGGLPAFDVVTIDAFAPAIRTAMASQLAEIEAIANNKKKPTFDNTIAAMESSGAELERVLTYYWVYNSTMSTPELRAIESELSPELAGLRDTIVQNAALFARIEAVYTHKKFDRLTAEQQRLTWRVYNRFVRAGAKLDDAAKAKMSSLNQELASLYTNFGQNLLADEDTWIELSSEEDLAGLPQGLIDAMAAAATRKGLDGKWIVMNTRSSVDPFLSWSERREHREAVWKAFVNRGDRGNATDNNALITKILALRAERAKVLGFKTHAHWRLEDSMAKTPEAAMELLLSVWKPAVARVHEEVAAQQAIAEADGIRIAPWDYRFYQEKVRKERFSLDQNEVKQYLQLEKLREGMFWVAGELYGLSFKQLSDVPVCHPDVRVWEVKKADGSHLGLWYFDPYARQGKRSGAWMNDYRPQSRYDGEQTPIVSNNSNFTKSDGSTLISWDDAETMFHEFGHALHGLLSNVTYPSLSGTNVARDYVEFPSQLNERWLGTPEVLQRFALHVDTGKPIPEALVKRLEDAATFNSGFGTVEYLASAIMDMKLHLAGDTPIDPDAFEKETLKALGMPNELVMRHRTPQFAHIFSGDGYAAGYYSYLWADAITADATEAFVEAGSMYDKETAKALYTWVMSVGDTIDPGEAFRTFRGRDVDTAALLRARGFPVE